MWTESVITELLRADIKRQRSVMVIHQFELGLYFELAFGAQNLSCDLYRYRLFEI